MLRFLWAHGPKRSKHFLLPLALIAGLSRDFVMIIINKAASAPIDVATHHWLPLFVLAFVLVLGSAVAYHILAMAVTTHITNEVRLKMIGNLLKTQPSFLEKHQHGAVYHILTTDVSIVANFITTALNILPSAIFLSIAMPQLFYYSNVAGFFAVLVMAGGSLSYFFQQKLLAKLNTDARQLDVDYFEQVSELLWGLRELRLHMPRREAFMRKLEGVLVKLRGVLIQVKKIYEIGEMATNSLKFMLFGGIVFLVPYLIKTEATVTFQLLTFVLFSLTPFEQIISSYPSFIAAIVTFWRIKDMNTQLEPYGRLQEVIPSTVPPFKTISLRKAVASYDSREKSDFVLGPINFDLRHSEIVFLVGNNGSGKSTFMNVIAGLHDLDRGKMLVDGKELKADDMGAYRARISAIFSWFLLFREMYGLENVDPKTASDAIQCAGLYGVTAFENGKVTRRDLSAGQKRRLALAILLLENRDILIFDEFGADQDPNQKEYFFRTLLPWLKALGKTIIVSTHELQWLDCCDRAFRFKNGKMTDITSDQVKAAKPALVPV
jgi:putative pyoverdin transport system ATP-binding/permease protein